MVIVRSMALNNTMAAVRSPDYRTLASLSRINLLRALQQGEPMTVEQLAAATGLHRNTAREHLHRLVAAGFVHCESQHKQARGRPRILYSTKVPRNDPALAERVRIATERARQVRQLVQRGRELPDTQSPDDARSIDVTTHAIQQQLDLLDDHMDRCGFDSTLDADALRMTMHDCPFLQLARKNPQVCEVHFGLVRETLAHADGPLEAEQLHPFAATNTCTLELCAAHHS
jgi:predicted ArsR family transcriptional regulator